MTHSRTAKPRAGAPQKRSLTDRQLVLIALGVHLALSLMLFDPKLATGGDNAQYFILAKSILQGRYADLHTPGAPSHTQYPPVLPLLMAPLVAVFRGSFIPEKLLMLLCGLASVYVSYLVLKRKTPGRTWFLPVMLFGVSPVFLRYCHDLYTEVPFILFSLLSLYCLARGEEAARHRLLLVGLSGLFAALSFLTRTLGFTFVLAGILYLLIRRRWTELGVFVAVAALFVLPWLIRDMRLPPGQGYFAQFLRREQYNPDSGNLRGVGDLVQRFARNVSDYLFKVFPQMLVPQLPDRGGTLAGLVGIAAFLLVAWGAGSTISTQRLGALELYFMLSLGVLTLWPNEWTGDRFLLPVLPFLMLYLVIGLRALSRLLKMRTLLTVACSIILFLLALSDIRAAGANLRDVSRYVRGDQFAGYDEPWRAYFEAGLWLKGHTEPDAIIVSRKPQFTYLYSGRQSVIYPFSADEQKVLRAIDSTAATYAYVENFFGQSARYLYPVVRDHPDRFEQVGSIGNGEARVIIFKIKR